MGYWEFLIQREGDRGWRPIKTGNLQLMEGKYRIVANSNFFNTEIETRVTHQTLGSTAPQRRSKSRTQVTNAKGLLVIIPFTNLQSGIWQFVCSGATSERTAWHRILKLRVLPRDRDRSPVAVTNISRQVDASVPESISPIPKFVTTIAPSKIACVERQEDVDPPTEPLVPMNMDDTSENWANGLDRLLEQIERESLQAAPQANSIALSTGIQLRSIVDPPLQPIHLDRSAFSGAIPGTHLIIHGACNLQLFNPHLVQTVKAERLSICLRHPQTSETIISIECPLPPNLHKFAFRGRLEIPMQPKISLLLGEVNLYDRHNIQISSNGFTVTVNLNPLSNSEISLLKLFDIDRSNLSPHPPIGQDSSQDLLDLELQLESFIPQPPFSHSQLEGFGSSARSIQSPSAVDSSVRADLHVEDPTDPFTHHRESVFTPDIEVVTPISTDRATSSTSQAPDDISRSDRHRSQPSRSDSLEITGDLDFDFVYPTFSLSGTLSSHDRSRSSQIHHRDAHDFDQLEIVVDD